MSGSRSWHGELSAASKRLLLEQILRERAGQPKLYPLSFAQQRLWFFDQLEPGNPVYNNCVAMRLIGRHDVDALARTLNEIIRRHEVLRTTFTVRDEQPVQMVSPTLDLSIAQLDLRATPDSQRERDVEWAVTEESLRPFDLGRGPLMRALLIRLTDDEGLLVLTIHHIVSDGWSLAVVLVRELAAIYRDVASGRSPSLPPLPMQYGEFSVWQRERLTGEVLREQLSFWRETLGGQPSVLELPTDFPRPTIQTFRGGSQSWVLPESLTEGLRRICRERKATPFMGLLAAFSALLCRLSGQEGVSLGSPITGRTRAETEGLIGFFVNTLVFRTDLSDDPSFDDLLERVVRIAHGAYTHQELPFDKLVEELHPERDLSRAPLFQVLFNMLSFPQDGRMELPGLTVELRGTPQSTSRFDLTLYVVPQRRTFSLSLVYNADLFSESRMSELLGQYDLLLQQVVERPEVPLSNHSLITTRARLRLPDPRVVLPEPPYELVTTTVLRWAERTPEQVAVCQGTRAWTYHELRQSAFHLARRLSAQRLCPGEVVAVAGSRSYGFITSMLAVFLSRGVLLSLDEDVPTHRQRLMLQEADAKHLLYVGTTPPEFLQAEGSHFPTIRVDPDTGEAAGSPPLESLNLPEPAPDDPAYIFFTSGSTGVPKGVLGCHKGLAHFLNWQRETFAVGPKDRVAQLTSLSFDAVLRDIFLPLTSGATLCLPDGSVAEGTLAWLARAQVSLLHAVPAIAQFWLSEASPATPQPTSLRRVFFAGEPLRDVLVRRWREVCPASEIVNLYGPTETTLVKCYHPVPAEVRPGIQSVGFPLPETQALVVSGGGQLCGVGEPGEVVLRTPFRTLGYLKSAAEATKKFVKNPWRDDDRDLLYYTGDFGRYRADGSLEVCGRADAQLKIHGVRVEPEEVAVVLAQHPAVKACVVTGWKNEEDQNALVAYVVPGEGRTPSLPELKRYLASRLLTAMIPSRFVFLDRLPLNANGKVDRQALPPPGRASAAVVAYEVPRTSTEEILAGIWSELLGVDRVGIHDNFFDLGGHSLLVTRVLFRVERTLGVAVPAKRLFEAPTIAALAEALERREASLPPARTIPAVSRQERRVLSVMQQQLWLFDRMQPGSPAYNVQVCFTLSGALDVEALRRSLDEVVRRHEVLRTGFTDEEGAPVAVIGDPYAVALPQIDLRGLEAAESEATRLFVEEAKKPFDLARGVLLRMLLIRVGEARHMLSLATHHIVCDGWSAGILVRELLTAYQAFCAGRVPDLPPLPVQFGDYAIWQRQWLESEAAKRQLDYWCGRLAGPLPVIELPQDLPRPIRQTFRGGHHSITLPQELGQALALLSHEQAATRFMVLLAAFAFLVKRLTGLDDLPIGVPVAGRDLPETEGLMGVFVNTLVMRLDASRDPTFRDMLERTRAIALEGYQNAQLPFERLVEALHPPRSAARTPLFQVMVNSFDRVARRRVGLPGLDVEIYGEGPRISKFDLTLYVAPEGDATTILASYNADLFCDERMQEFLGQYCHVLEQVCARPDRRLSEISLVTPTAQGVLPEPRRPLRSEAGPTFVARFLQQARCAPDRPAVVDAGGTLTYGELEQRSRGVAQRLQAAGVGQGDLVALYVHRSAGMLWSLLGVLRAGAGFVILDPDHPTTRLAECLRAAQPRAWLGVPGAGEPPPALDAMPWALRAEATPAFATPDATADWCPPTPAAGGVAYVAFTSTTTGGVKGIVGTHGPVAHFLGWHTRRFGLTEQDRFSMLSGLSHDPLLRDVFAPLWVGGALCIPDPDNLSNPAGLRTWMAEEGVTVSHLTPPLARVLTEGTSDGELPRLRLICLGGDVLTGDEVQSLRRLAPGAKIVNFYGATETPQAMGWYEVPPDSDGHPGRMVPVGRGIDDVQLLVLTENGQLAGIGELGEIEAAVEQLAGAKHGVVAARDDARGDRQHAAYYVPPRTPLEEGLARIWTEVLGVERVGAHDNFFDLGGHSLLVTRVLSRVERALGVAIPVPSFFELLTIGALATEIERRRSQGQAAQPGSEIKIISRVSHRVRADSLDRRDTGGSTP